MMERESGFRKSLSQDIRKLIGGRITNDDFDDVYHEHYVDAEDLVVREIAGYCYGLYSSGLLHPIRLTGRNAVDNETRSECARAILLLRSGQVYKWPARKGSFCKALLEGIAFLLLPIGIAFLLLAVVLLETLETEMGVRFLASGLMALFSWRVHKLARRKSSVLEWDAFKSAGDYDVWPFLRMAIFT